MTIQIHIADPHYLENLHDELNDIIATHGDLIIAKTQNQLPVFALDTWLDPQIIDIESITDAANKLKPLAKYWAPYINQFARRTTLISEKLRHFNLPKAQHFPLEPLPQIAQFTLLDKHQLVFATKRIKAIPNGQFNFIEDKTNPPNRAYLKLWEALSILQKYPQPGDFALDIGAAPGGWTYVLQSLGAQVLAVDKASLDPRIAELPGVTFKPCSAFSLLPSDFQTVDWLVCDMACYPEKLYQWLVPWLQSGIVKNYVITIKLQGAHDLASIHPFQQLPHCRIIHLQHNKHEVTLLLGSKQL